MPKKDPAQVFSDRVYDILKGINPTNNPVWSLDDINRAATRLLAATKSKVSEADIDTWVKNLLAKAGVRQVGSLLVNVPAKYVSIINCMHGALVELAAGEPLPEVVTNAEKKRGGT